MNKNILIILLVSMALALNGYSQISYKWTTDLQAGADLMSRYIWRGLDLGGAGPSIQPTLKLNTGTANHVLSLGAWGAYTFSATANQEIDLALSYTYKDLFTLTVTDYFFPGYNSGKSDQYFCYTSDSTGHVFEGMTMFNGTEKFPFTFLVATNFYGKDARKMKQINDTTWIENGLQYSTYIEMGFYKNFKVYDLNVFMGGVINNPQEKLNESGYYGNSKAGITNIGIKVSHIIPVTEKYALPVQASLIANPVQNKLYFIIGISL